METRGKRILTSVSITAFWIVLLYIPLMGSTRLGIFHTISFMTHWPIFLLENSPADNDISMIAITLIWYALITGIGTLVVYYAIPAFTTKVVQLKKLKGHHQ